MKCLDVLYTVLSSCIEIGSPLDCLLLSLVPQLLAMMVDLEDDPDWSKSDEIEDEDYERYLLLQQFYFSLSLYIFTFFEP